MPPAYQDEEKFPQPRCKRGNEPPPTRLPQNDLPLSQPSCSYILSTQQSYHSYTNSMSTMVFPGIHSDRTATPLTGRTSLQVENSQHQTSSRPQNTYSTRAGTTNGLYFISNNLVVISYCFLWLLSSLNIHEIH